MATCSRDTRGASAFGWLPSVSPYAQLQCAQRHTWKPRSSSRCESCRGRRTATASCSGNTWCWGARRMTSAYATSPGGYRRGLSRGVSPRPSDVSRRTHTFSAYLIGREYLARKVGVYDLRIHAAAAGCTQFCVHCHDAVLAVKSGTRCRGAEGPVHAHCVMMRPTGQPPFALGRPPSDGQSLEPGVHAMHIAEL